MTFIDLFAGVGGFRRGMELAGHKCIGFCEWDNATVASYTSMHLLTDEQRCQLAKLPLKQRQKEILKEEYRNGEWYAHDIRDITGDSIPRADCWCFGAPCQDFSVAGRRAGLGGDRSSPVREVFRILGEMQEADRPEWLIYENVKGMLSSNRGFDFLAILLEMDELGYDIEWEIFNTKNFGVPQNRERVYTVGHLRAAGRAEIFPLKGADGEDNPVGVEQIGRTDRPGRDNLNQYRVYSMEATAPCLNKMDGGGREPHIPIQIEAHYPSGNQRSAMFDADGAARTLSATDYKQPVSVMAPIGGLYSNVSPSHFHGILDDCSRCLKAEKNDECVALAIPVLTPDRAEKRQNGRRFKEDGEEAFTLTSQDIHGVALGVAASEEPESEHPGVYVQLAEDCIVYAVWYKKYGCYIAIRKLTPRECFRLQGWTDEYFNRAEFVNSNSQLYKQAGNGVTVTVTYAIGQAIDVHGNSTKQIKRISGVELW